MEGQLIWVGKDVWVNDSIKSRSTTSLLLLLLQNFGVHLPSFFLRRSGHPYSITHLREPKVLIVGSKVVKLNTLTIGNCYSFPTFNELDWVDCFASLLSDQDEYLKFFNNILHSCSRSFFQQRFQYLISCQHIKMIHEPFHLLCVLNCWAKIMASLVSYWFCFLQPHNLLYFSQSLFLSIISLK